MASSDHCRQVRNPASDLLSRVTRKKQAPGRGQCHSPQILCSAAPASAGAASVVSTRSVPVVVAVAATVGSVACVVVAADLAVHVEF